MALKKVNIKGTQTYKMVKVAPKKRATTRKKRS